MPKTEMAHGVLWGVFSFIMSIETGLMLCGSVQLEIVDVSV